MTLYCNACGFEINDQPSPARPFVITFGIKEFPLIESTPNAMLCAPCAKEWERDVKEYQSQLYRVFADLLRGRWSNFLQWRQAVKNNIAR